MPSFARYNSSRHLAGSFKTLNQTILQNLTIDFDHKKQFQQKKKQIKLNYLIMITINLFDSNWWRTYREINVFKNINKLCFDQNNKKVGIFSLLI